MEIVGDPWSTAEKKQIEPRAHEEGEPENRIIVFMLRLLEVDEGRGKTAVLQTAGDSRENRNHTYQSIIGGIEQAGQEDADDGIQYLHAAIVHGGPKKA